MRRKNLIFIAGYAGSGKTMVGKMIAAKLQAIYIDKDTTTKRVVEQALRLTTGDPNDRLSEFYINNFKMSEYDAMLDIAWENLKLSSNAILVAPFTPGKDKNFFANKDWVAKINKQSNKIQVKWHVIWVKSNNQRIKEMLMSRKTPRDNWKLANWEEYTKIHPDIDDPRLPIDNYTVLDNNGRNLHDISNEIDKILQDIGASTANEKL